MQPETRGIGFLLRYGAAGVARFSTRTTHMGDAKRGPLLQAEKTVGKEADEGRSAHRGRRAGGGRGWGSASVGPRSALAAVSRVRTVRSGSRRGRLVRRIARGSVRLGQGTSGGIRRRGMRPMTPPSPRRRAVASSRWGPRRSGGGRNRARRTIVRSSSRRAARCPRRGRPREGRRRAVVPLPRRSARTTSFRGCGRSCPTVRGELRRTARATWAATPRRRQPRCNPCESRPLGSRGRSRAAR